MPHLEVHNYDSRDVIICHICAIVGFTENLIVGLNLVLI
uniref:Uncharacterized protein n=1 Tax=Siphoviridae sp. ctxjx4 TaxID=2826522 RepID=A0A8S5M1Z9_9CAUD|nr:MAG TPA: hypothetical protein [Siphoviridae sp. ctxjx4]